MSPRDPQTKVLSVGELRSYLEALREHASRSGRTGQEGGPSRSTAVDDDRGDPLGPTTACGGERAPVTALEAGLRLVIGRPCLGRSPGAQHSAEALAAGMLRAPSGLEIGSNAEPPQTGRREGVGAREPAASEETLIYHRRVARRPGRRVNRGLLLRGGIAVCGLMVSAPWVLPSKETQASSAAAPTAVTRQGRDMPETEPRREKAAEGRGRAQHAQEQGLAGRPVPAAADRVAENVKPAPVLMPSVRHAVNLLLSGDSRLALDAYRALASASPDNQEFALAVRLLERELSRCLPEERDACP